MSSVAVISKGEERRSRTVASRRSLWRIRALELVQDCIFRAAVRAARKGQGEVRSRPRSHLHYCALPLPEHSAIRTHPSSG